MTSHRMSGPPLPAAYIARMTSLLGDEAAAFFDSTDRPARPGLRVDPAKIDPEAFRQRAPWPLEPVPWCPEGFYLPADAPAGKHPWHAAGVYYLQEPSAMAPAGALDLPPAARVADLCAAPGGKATQIHSRLDRNGSLFANEIIGSRIKPLGENLERWGAAQAVIANHSIDRLANDVPGMFDRVLLDAPCSGEGLFRRTPEARTHWSPAHVAGSARRQQGLLTAAARLVVPGGVVVYSTCTFAPEENEQIIAAFLDTHPAWTLDPITEIPGAAPGRPDWAATTHDLSGIARLWPHRVEGDGHTIARLRHRGDEDSPLRPAPPRPLPRVSADAERTFREFQESTIPEFDIDRPLLQIGDALVLPPPDAEPLLGVPLVRSGLWLGTLHPGRFTPSHALALHLSPDRCRLTEPLDAESAARYLAGEPLTRSGEPGWVLMTFDGFALGWGKRSGDVIKNHYPKGLRRPAASWLSAVG